MKVLLCFVVLLVCVGFYFHNQQPQLWNRWAALIAARDMNFSDWTHGAPEPTNAVVVVVPPPRPQLQEITPYTTKYTNTSHVIPIPADVAAEDEKTDASARSVSPSAAPTSTNPPQP